MNDLDEDERLHSVSFPRSSDSVSRAAAIKVGERVVVTVIETKGSGGKGLWVANNVRLAAAVAAPPQPKR